MKKILLCLALVVSVNMSGAMVPMAPMRADGSGGNGLQALANFFKHLQRLDPVIEKIIFNRGNKEIVPLVELVGIAKRDSEAEALFNEMSVRMMGDDWSYVKESFTALQRCLCTKHLLPNQSMESGLEVTRVADSEARRPDGLEKPSEGKEKHSSDILEDRVEGTSDERAEPKSLTAHYQLYTSYWRDEIRDASKLSWIDYYTGKDGKLRELIWRGDGYYVFEGGKFKKFNLQEGRVEEAVSSESEELFESLDEGYPSSSDTEENDPWMSIIVYPSSSDETGETQKSSDVSVRTVGIRRDRPAEEPEMRRKKIARWEETTLVREVPELVALWDTEKNGDIPEDLGTGSTRKFCWLCPVVVDSETGKRKHDSHTACVNDMLRSIKNPTKGCKQCRTEARWRAINLIDPETGKIIGTYSSIRAVAEELAKGDKEEVKKIENGISKVLRDRKKSCRGYSFSYADGEGTYRRGLLRDECPELFAQLDEAENRRYGIEMHKLTPGSAKKVWWKCLKGHASYEAMVSNRVNLGTGCPECAVEESRKPVNATYDDGRETTYESRTAAAKDLGVTQQAVSFACNSKGKYKGKDGRIGIADVRVKSAPKRKRARVSDADSSAGEDRTESEYSSDVGSTTESEE